MVWKIILAVLFGYAVGNINPSYIIGRLRGFDIRKKGSRNAGASNAVITMGKAIGIGSALFDILKATAVVWLSHYVFFKDVPYAAEIAGVSCILGHIYPAVMKFRGGKGLACLGGVILAFDWRLFLMMLAAEIVLAVLFDYICVIPVTASILLPLFYGFFGADGTGWLWRGAGSWRGALILAVATVVILTRHIENFKRIRKGTEMHLSYLWKKDKAAEVARIAGAAASGNRPDSGSENAPPERRNT